MPQLRTHARVSGTVAGARVSGGSSQPGTQPNPFDGHNLSLDCLIIIGIHVDMYLHIYNILCVYIYVYCVYIYIYIVYLYYIKIVNTYLRIVYTHLLGYV